MEEELTEKEKQILYLIAKGMHNKEIAKELNISTHTVKTHIETILYKLNVRNRIQAGIKAVLNGIISTENLI